MAPHDHGFVHVSESEESWAEETADEVLAAFERVETPAITFCLSGGSTPARVYDVLAKRTFEWERVRFYFGDERCVLPSSEQSNYRSGREHLFGPLGIDEKHIFRMKGEYDDREEAALEYEAALPEAFDLLLLGMGGDGHTASLFPGSRWIKEVDRRVAPAKADVEPRQRLTITPPVIQSAREVMVLVTGSGKASMVARALEGEWDPMEIPSQLARFRRWILDPGAASAIRDR